jgi:hypothetical protein
MKEEIIRTIGIYKKVKDLERFVKFFSKRFPDEDDRVLSYVSEWADRFNTGHPENYMDTKSKCIYLGDSK